MAEMMVVWWDGSLAGCLVGCSVERRVVDLVVLSVVPADGNWAEKLESSLVERWGKRAADWMVGWRVAWLDSEAMKLAMRRADCLAAHSVAGSVALSNKGNQT